MSDAPGGLAPLSHAQALALHRQGDLSAARGAYEQILAADPENFEALHHLGILLLQAGDAGKALELLRRAAARGGNCAAVHADLATAMATALAVLRRHDEAIACYEDALAIAPELAEAHYGLGTVMLALARLDEANACFQRALAIDADYVEAHGALAASWRAAGRNAEAIARYQKELAIDPEYAEAQFGLATALAAARRFEEAIRHYRQAISLDPGYAEAYNGLGLALDAQNDHTEALASFAQALAIRPDYAEAHANRGMVLQIAGDIAEARRAFARACDLEPRRPGHYFALANAAAMREGDPYLAAMTGLARELPSLSLPEQIQLHFALGKALCDVGDRAAAFEHLARGNALKRSQISYDEASTLILFDRIRDVFTPQLLREKAGHGHPSAAPVFIVGMPRSGSTLVEQILASHPCVFAAGERDELRSAVRRAGADGGESPFPEAVRGLSGQRLYALGASYLEQIGALAARAGDDAMPERITDKTLMHFNLLGLIRLVLPNAHIIHIRRNPIDTCLSCYSKLFDDELPFAYDLGELGGYYGAYDALMKYWRAVLPEGWVLDVSYEALIGDFEAQARRIVAHCGLGWDDACLAFHETRRPIRTASATQVRQPLYRSSVEPWRPDAARLAPLLRALGA